MTQDLLNTTVITTTEWFPDRICWVCCRYRVSEREKGIGILDPGDQKTWMSYWKVQIWKSIQNYFF